MPSRDYLSTPPLSNAQHGIANEASMEAPMTPMTPKRPEKKSSLYKTELCRSWEETGQCRLIDRHPKYKTEMCKTFWDKGTCPYGKRCCFIHNEKEKILEYQLAQKKLAEEGIQAAEGESDLNFVNQISAESSPALSVSSEILPMRRKATIEGSSFPFLLENSSPMEIVNSSPSRRYTILPPGIPLDPVQDLTDILQETYLDSTLQDDAIFRDIINSDDNQAKSPSISIPNSPNMHSARMPFMSNLSGTRNNGMFGFSNIISPSMASTFSNADLFEESSPGKEPFNDDLFSKSWSVHSTHREPRARTFTETSVQLSDNFGLTNLVPVDESIGF